MHLKRLLGALAMESFLADYFYHRPYSGTGLATHLTPLGTVDAFSSIVTHGDADVMICRRNEPFAGSPPRDVDAMRDLLGQGYTILVKHAERHEARLAEVAASFARDFAADVNIRSIHGDRIHKRVGNRRGKARIPARIDGSGAIGIEL